MSKRPVYCRTQQRFSRWRAEKRRSKYLRITFVLVIVITFISFLTTKSKFAGDLTNKKFHIPPVTSSILCSEDKALRDGCAAALCLQPASSDWSFASYFTYSRGGQVYTQAAQWGKDAVVGFICSPTSFFAAECHFKGTLPKLFLSALNSPVPAGFEPASSAAAVRCVFLGAAAAAQKQLQRELSNTVHWSVSCIPDTCMLPSCL